ncbi:MAG: hypothetical protein ABIV43_03560 [Candidatus Saccharimonadales bacterium]
MPPRENQFGRPLQNTPPPRRVSDAGSPSRPAYNPVNRPLSPRPLTYPVSTPPPAAPTEDLGLALAGPTPTVSTPSPATTPLLNFERPTPLESSPATDENTDIKPKRRRLRLPNIPWHRVLRRRVLVPTAIVAAVALAGYGAFALVQYQRLQASPDTVYRQALINALMTRQVAIDVQSSSTNTSAQLDFSNPKSPRVSTDTTTTIAGSSFRINTYGSASNTFFAYKALPAGLDSTTASSVVNDWVRLRKGGVLPAAINTSISNAADPRFQAFGPLVFANLPEKTSRTVAKFLVDNHVYGYKLANVETVPVGKSKALLFHGKFNSD